MGRIKTRREQQRKKDLRAFLLYLMELEAQGFKVEFERPAVEQEKELLDINISK